MPSHSFFGYSPNALVYDGSTGTFKLNVDYDWRTDRARFELDDDDQFFDGDASNNEVGEDANQTATVFDGSGNTISDGQVYVEQIGWLQASDGSYVTIDRIEIDGVNMGYVPSEPLEPGVVYTYVGTTDIDNGDNNGGSDTRASYDYYKENSVPCFGPDTRVLTTQGDVPVQWMRAGEMVITRDHGPQPIIWIGRYTIEVAKMQRTPALMPLCLPNTEGAPLILSRQHRIFLSDARFELLFGDNEVLCAARHFVDAHPVHPKGTTFTYYSILCDQHEVILANGLWAETLLYDGQSDAIGQASSCAPPDRDTPQTAARYCVKAWEARLIASLLSTSEALPAKSQVA